MAKRASTLFVDTDEDSIETASTEASEANEDAEYPVEKILAEEIGADGQLSYLLKWEGYPMHRCTWEVQDNVGDGILLREWQREKAAVKRGEKKPFDVGIYLSAYEQWKNEKEARQKRRRDKRRKRGETVDSPYQTDDTSGSEDELSEDVASPRRTKMAALPVRRKGVAQRVAKRQKTSAGRDVEDYNETSSADEEPLSRSKQRAGDLSSEDEPLMQERRLAGRHVVPQESPKPARVTSMPQQTSATEYVSKTNVPVSAVRKTVPATTAARKSAPAPPALVQPAQRRASSNVFGEDWAADKKRRQRVRVSGKIPKDSQDPKFRNLSEQNRYQRYGENEPPPDLNALVMIDPKTGATEPAKDKPLSRMGPTEIPKVYGRRTPPLQEDRRRSVSPRPPVERRQTEPQAMANTRLAEPPRAISNPKKLITCRDWVAGNCRFTSDTCWFAHEHLPTVPAAAVGKQQSTCYWWRTTGRCKKADHECRSAHYDTGIHAGAPGTYNPNRPIFAAASAVATLAKPVTCWWWTRGRCRKSDAECQFAHHDTGVHAEEPNSRRNSIATRTLATEDSSFALPPGHSSPNDMFYDAQERLQVGQSPVQLGHDINPAASHVNAAANAEFQPEAAHSHTSMAVAAHETTANMNLAARLSTSPPREPSPAKDPRLRGRTRERAVASPTSPTMPSLKDFEDGSLEADYRLAQSGHLELDSTLLLGRKEGILKNVFIYMPKEREAEAKLCEMVFGKKFGRKVYTSKPGDLQSWHYVRKYEKSCLVILHPTELYIETLPGLHQYIMERGSNVRVFSIGVQHERCIREQRKPTYEAQRLFSQGGITFLSDDLLSYYPDKATAIINTFLKETRDKPPGAESSRIGARPGVKDWMLRLAQQKFEEQGGEGKCTDLRWIECYDALCRLCPPEDEDPDYPDHSVPLGTSHLWSVWEESMPSFKGRWESGDEEGATQYMVEHFAGESCAKAWLYRKFLFVYQRPDQEKSVDSQGAESVEQDVDPKGWMQKYCHIGVVTPDQVLMPTRTATGKK